MDSSVWATGGKQHTSATEPEPETAVAYEKYIGARPRQFLIECLVALDKNLQSKFNSRLLIFRGDPATVLPHLVSQWGISHIYAEEEGVEPYWKLKDNAVEESLAAGGTVVKFIKIHGHTLYPPADVVKANNNRAPLTFNGFVKAISSLPTPPLPLPEPTFLPEIDMQQVLNKFKNQHPTRMPTLKDFGFTQEGGDGDDAKGSSRDFVLNPPNKHFGGEDEANKAFEAYFQDKKRVALFEKPKSSPAAYNPASTTLLSPHLRHGTLSSRTFYHRLLQIYKEFPKQHSQPPVSLLGQLYWREFYYVVASSTKNFDGMVGNPICLQIPWWCQKEERDDDDTDVVDEKIAREHLEKWKTAQTGYPWIDAIMTQLRTEGWIHHLARHSVACFLTRGHLFISWERGAQVFEEFLLDYDWSLNAGNWMWLSASAFFHQYFRVYSPIAFGKGFDKTGKYIRKYLPQLSKFPTEYIYEPWKAPLGIQRQAGCIIGVDYPAPIVDHEEARKKNLEKMKIAYSIGRKGSDGGSGSSKSHSGSAMKRKHHEEELY